MTYTDSVSSLERKDALNVEVSDVLTAGESFVSASPSQGTFGGGVWTVGTVTTGSPQTLTLIVNVSAALPGGATLTNTATVTSTTTDPNPANNASTVTTTVVAPSADLSVSKTGPATVVAGQNMTY